MMNTTLFRLPTVYITGPVEECTEKQIWYWRYHVVDYLKWCGVESSVGLVKGSTFTPLEVSRSLLSQSDILFAYCWKQSMEVAASLVLANSIWEGDRSKIHIVVSKGDSSLDWYHSLATVHCSLEEGIAAVLTGLGK